MLADADLTRSALVEVPEGFHGGVNTQLYADNLMDVSGGHVDLSSCCQVSLISIFDWLVRPYAKQMCIDWCFQFEMPGRVRCALIFVVLKVSVEVL